MAVRERSLRGMGTTHPAGGRSAEELAGLDALEVDLTPERSFGSRLWASAWPKLAAIGLVILLWQTAVWLGWRKEYALPSPFTVLDRLWSELGTVRLWRAVGITMVRALRGFGVALVIGVVLGGVVARNRIMRAALGSLITGLQTMPSIAWFPAAILMFGLTEEAITFVVILGAAPSIANGLIGGIDQIPPLLLRAGRVLGARGLGSFRHIILPAAMPGFVAGLKQGWSFAWRSLLAGELLVTIANQQSLGLLLAVNREVSDAVGLYAIMIVILVIGVLVDAVLFGTLERSLRRRRGLLVDSEK